MTITHELIIEAPVPDVWALTVDVEAWPAMTPTITSVQRLDTGPLRVGSTARIKQPGQSARIWTVTTLEPNEAFAWETKVFGMRMIGGHRLEQVGEGCRNVLSVGMSGALSGIVEGLLERQLRKTIATENEGFRRAALAAHQ